ncbi:hypothetical protein [Streptomyces sp. AM6-12]|uniref:hypothetical protein n=1 Tax=Streptomyces sp. AM6-12 TaxID=3345149 RepID=UPI0037A88599
MSVEAWNPVNPLHHLGVPDGTPYLLSPIFAYDVHLNSYFHRVDFLESPLNSQNATGADHLAYHHWRRRDVNGPRVDGGTWSQEVSHLQQFYLHAVSKGWVSEVPIPQRAPREWSGHQVPGRVRPLLEAHGHHINASTARLRTPADVATFLAPDSTQTKVKTTS